jgi:hypothetical protein
MSFANMLYWTITTTVLSLIVGYGSAFSWKYPPTFDMGVGEWRAE